MPRQHRVLALGWKEALASSECEASLPELCPRSSRQRVNPSSFRSAGFQRGRRFLGLWGGDTRLTQQRTTHSCRLTDGAHDRGSHFCWYLLRSSVCIPVITHFFSCVRWGRDPKVFSVSCSAELVMATVPPTASACVSPILGDRLVHMAIALTPAPQGPLPTPGCNPEDSLPSNYYFYFSMHEVLSNFYVKKTFISGHSHTVSSHFPTFLRCLLCATGNTENVIQSGADTKNS